MPAAPACTAMQTHTQTHKYINTHTPAISTQGHNGEVKWVIAATQINNSWGDQRYALIQIWDLFLDALSNLYMHARSGIVIQKTKHKSITHGILSRQATNWSSWGYISWLFVPAPPARFFSLSHCSALTISSLFTLQCIIHYISTYITESKLWTDVPASDTISVQFRCTCLLIGVDYCINFYYHNWLQCIYCRIYVMLNWHIHGNTFHFLCWGMPYSTTASDIPPPPMPSDNISKCVALSCFVVTSHITTPGTS